MPERPDDLPPEAAAAVPLARAFRSHADPKLAAAFKVLENRLDREGRWHYVGTPSKIEDRVLSEFDSHGRRLLEEMHDLMARIEAGFMAKLRCGDLTAWAREGTPLAPWREIPPSVWATIQLDDVMKGTANGPGVVLFDLRIGPRVVPDALTAPLTSASATGAPGRPSSMHLIEAEFDGRRQAGTVEASLAREAEALAEWFKANHADKQPVTAKTIANRLRQRYREARNEQT